MIVLFQQLIGDVGGGGRRCPTGHILKGGGEENKSNTVFLIYERVAVCAVFNLSILL